MGAHTATLLREYIAIYILYNARARVYYMRIFLLKRAWVIVPQAVPIAFIFLMKRSLSFVVYCFVLARGRCDDILFRKLSSLTVTGLLFE